MRASGGTVALRLRGPQLRLAEFPSRRDRPTSSGQNEPSGLVGNIIGSCGGSCSSRDNAAFEDSDTPNSAPHRDEGRPPTRNTGAKPAGRSGALPAVPTAQQSGERQPI